VYKKACIDCELKSDAVKALSYSEFELLNENSVCVFFKKGDVIIKQGAHSLNVAYLKTGLVKTHMNDGKKEKIFRIKKAPVFLGISTTFGDKINNYSVTAIEDTTVCFFDASLFKQLIFKNGAFGYCIVENLCDNELIDYRKHATQAQKQTPGLVANVLLCLKNDIYNKDTFHIPLTRTEIGNMVGVSRESVSRVLANFSSEGIIDISTKEVTIIKEDVLLQISKNG